MACVEGLEKRLRDESLAFQDAARELDEIIVQVRSGWPPAELEWRLQVFSEMSSDPRAVRLGIPAKLETLLSLNASATQMSGGGHPSWPPRPPLGGGPLQTEVDSFQGGDCTSYQSIGSFLAVDKPEIEHKDLRHPSAETCNHGGGYLSAPPPGRSRNVKSSFQDNKMMPTLASFLEMDVLEVESRWNDGRLEQDLANCTQIRSNAGGNDGTMFIRPNAVMVLMTPGMDDDAAVASQLVDDARQHCEAFVILQDNLVAGQERMNSLEDQVAQASANVEEGMKNLLKTKELDEKTKKWFWPLVAGATVGVMVPASLPISLAVGSFTTVTTAIGRSELKKRQASSLALLESRMPRSLAPLSAEDSETVRVLGDAVHERFLDSLFAAPWAEAILSYQRFKHRQEADLESQPLSLFWSKTRDEGERDYTYAWKTTFEIPMPAVQAFRTLQALNAGGILDSTAELQWNFPVSGCIGAQEPGESPRRPSSTTSVCLAAYTSRSGNQRLATQYLSLCRTDAAEREGKTVYLIAHGAPPPDTELPSSIPRPQEDFMTGQIYSAGFLVEDVAAAAESQSSKCRITVFVDADPLRHWGKGARHFTGCRVKDRLLTAAAKIQSKLLTEAADLAGQVGQASSSASGATSSTTSFQSAFSSIMR